MADVTLDAVLDDAIDIATRAGDLALGHWRTDLAVDSKSDGTEVTVADRGAEVLVRELVAERFPADAVVGEEFPDTPGTSGRSWIVDPIDGTYGFVRGVPLFSTLLSMYDDEGCAVGVIRLPALGLTVAAARGVGCHLDGVVTHVSTTSTVSGALLCTSDWSAASSDQLAAVHGAGLNMRTWGDGYGYAMVATGAADGMLDPICSPWDLAPMPVIITEAGGRFTDLTGVTRHDGGHGLASNGLVHDELLALVGS